ncbi:MAG: UPF0182 family protein, partial [Rhodospirillales bacterium]|nr:UPF0182 family protein [Rhodospirillales bacterium]
MPLSIKAGTGFWVSVAAGILVLILLFGLLGWTVEWLWMGELGYSQVFWRVRLTQIGLFAGLFVPVVFYFWINGLFLRRIMARAQASAPAAAAPWASGAADPAPGWAIRASSILLPF